MKLIADRMGCDIYEILKLQKPNLMDEGLILVQVLGATAFP